MDGRSRFLKNRHETTSGQAQGPNTNRNTHDINYFRFALVDYRSNTQVPVIDSEPLTPIREIGMGDHFSSII